MIDYRAKMLTKDGIICVTGEPFVMPAQERPVKKICSQPANHGELERQLINNSS